MTTSRTLRSSRRLLTIAAVTLALAAAWFFLAPQQLGGSTAYVTTFGTSMEPRFEAGDLVLVRQTDQYDVGDVAAYRSEELGGTIVLHRIVAREGDGYVFKGDNNSWLDSERPDRKQLVGKLWLDASGAGKVLELRTPRNMAVLAGVAMLLLLGGGGGAAARRRRRRRGQVAATPPRRPASYAPAQAGRVLAPAAGLLLIGSLALGALAYSSATTESVESAVSYGQTGTFEYSAPAPQGPVYPGGRVRTGDPVFLRLVDRVDVRFGYRLESDLPARVSGTAALGAEIVGATGWTRRLELQKPLTFEGPRVEVRGTLRLDRIRALLTRVERATGLAEGSYTVTLVPEIRVEGTLADEALADDFSPRLPFTLDQLQLRVQLPEAEPGAATPLRPEKEGSVEVPRTQPASLPLPKVDIRVETARKAAAGGAAIALAGLLAAALLLLAGRRADEPARIRARYGPWLVPVAQSHRRDYDEVVEVTSMEKLVELAERYDRMILHEETELGHSYRIADDGVLYVYLVGAEGRVPTLPLPTLETERAEKTAGERSSAPNAPTPGRRGFLRGLLGGRDED